MATMVKPIEVTPLAILGASLPSHRVYYSCIPNYGDDRHTKKVLCMKGHSYGPFTYEVRHICVFAAKPEELDAHFEKKFPDAKVVKSLNQ